MAIIRIKRTGGTAAPSGLTFGELAFVGATAGATAERVYIGGIAGDSIWVGARILNSVPNTTEFFSGATADTTIPTVRGMRDFVSTFVGATAFSSNITLNLSPNRSFGKYITGQTIQAAGKTPIQVILDALVEYIVMVASLSPRQAGSTQIPFGIQGNITLGLTYSYQLNTPGFTATGATLEWQQSATSPNLLTSGWNLVSGTFYDTTAPFTIFPTEGGGGFTGTATQTVTHTQWSTTPYQFRYNVRDNSNFDNGFTFTYATITPQSFENPRIVGTPGITATTTLTRHVGNDGLVREMGNTATTVNVTLAVGANMSTAYHNLSEVGFQYSPNQGSTWYSAAGVANNYTAYAMSPSLGITGTTFTISAPVPNVPNASGMTAMWFRFFAKQGTTGAPGSNVGWGITIDPPTSSRVSFRKRIFYGPTGTNPTTWSGSDIRSLPLSFLAAPAGTAYTREAPGTFTFSTGNQYKFFVIALPDGLTLNASANPPTVPYGAAISAADIWVGKSDPTNDPMQLSATITTVPDVSGVNQDYNVYILSLGDPYGSSQTVSVAYNGTIQ